MNTFEVKNIIEGKQLLGDCCKINMQQYSTIYYYSNATNCKLCTFEYLGQIFRNSPNKDNIDNFRKILIKTNKRMFFTHVTSEETVKHISKYYKLIYCQEVPLGYNGGMQYHCAFLINPKDETYGKRVDEKNKYSDITSSFNSIYNQNVELKKQVSKIIVEDNNLIEQFIIKASNEEINKLRSYKQPKRKKDLITKIITKV